MIQNNFKVGIGYIGSFSEEVYKQLTLFKQELEKALNMSLILVFYNQKMINSNYEKTKIVYSLSNFLNENENQYLFDLSLFSSNIDTQYQKLLQISPVIASWEQQYWFVRQLQEIYNFEEIECVVTHSSESVSFIQQKFTKILKQQYPHLLFKNLRNLEELPQNSKKILPLFLCPGKHLNIDLGSCYHFYDNFKFKALLEYPQFRFALIKKFQYWYEERFK